MRRLVLILALLFAGPVFATTSFNVWTPEGNVVPNSGGAVFSNPNVLYLQNSVVLHPGSPSTFVFKMWCMAKLSGTYSTYYFESDDGLTSWTPYASNPIDTSASPTVPKIYFDGTTYYYYAGFGAIGARTSTDGVTLSGATTAISAGASGDWDKAVYQLQVIDKIGSTYYGYFNGENATYSPPSQMGLATSTDLIHWTKDPGNPKITILSSNFTFFKVGSTYYGLFDGAPNNAQLITNKVRNIYMVSATNVSGPWTEFSYGGNPLPVFYAAIPADFGSFNTNNAIGDPSIVSDGTSLYLYYSVSPSGAATGLDGAKAINTSFTQLASAYQGVVGAPFSDAPSLNLNTLASDSGTGANANPIGGNWSAAGTFGTMQRASNVFESSTASTGGAEYNNTQSWAADQWAIVKAQACSSGSDVAVALRLNTSGTISAYIFYWTGALGGSGTWSIQKRTGGVNTTLVIGTGLTVSAGDTIMGVVNGSNLIFYWNGYAIGAATDSAIASGQAGQFIFPNGAVTVAKQDTWSGGTFQAAPPISGGNAGGRAVIF